MDLPVVESLPAAGNGGATAELVAPATGEPAFRLAALAPERAGEAVPAVREGAREWAALPLLERGRVLMRVAELVRGADGLAELMAADVGKPLAEARPEVERTARIFEYAAAVASMPAGELYEDSAGGTVRVLRRPRGAVVLITPWNFPLAIPAWKLAPALLCGNGVVLKPATPAARLGRRLVEIVHAAGVPVDALRLVVGGAATATALLDARPDAVSFTGSTETGRSIAARLGPLLVPVQLEMGGKNAVYVSEAADPETAARVVLAGGFGYAGQKCTATSRVFAHERVAPALREALHAQAQATAVGDPLDEKTVVGPMIDAGARDRVAAELDAAAGRGIEVGLGGHALDRPGAFLAPTLVSGGSADDPVYTEELFAPVVGVVPVASFEEGVARVNAVRYGLVAGIVTPLRDEVERFAREAEAGIVRVNAPTTGVEPHVPFGGAKDSSFGQREQGLAGVAFFSETRTIYA